MNLSSKKELKRTKKEIESAIRQVDNEIISELGKREASIGITQKTSSVGNLSVRDV